MFWKNEVVENNYGGWTDVEKVQVYECQFSYKREHQKTARDYTTNGRCLVVCNTVEEAIAACRARFPKEFVLHAIHKRNQRCDLIVCDSVLPLAEKGE